VSSADLRQVALLLALVDTQSLSQAAERLSLTPSAASQSLDRLRELFGDELVQRQGSGYRLTATGQGALGSFREMARLWQEATSGAILFDPASTEVHLSIACVEGFVEIDLEACYAAVIARAPGLRLDVRTCEGGAGDLDSLHAAHVDVLLTGAAPPADAADLHAEQIMGSEHSHCCLSESHPRVRERLSLQQYLAEQHLLLPAATRGAQTGSRIDQALTGLGLGARRFSLVQPLSRLATLLATTDRLATVTRQQGAVLVRLSEGLRLLPLPPEVPRVPLERHMVWHHRTHNSPPHRWLRERLRDFVYAEAQAPPEMAA
jgi:LysR family nod box-dependent transcriptional activator